MPVLKDYYCKKCDILYEDVKTSTGEVIHICPQCKNETEWIPSKMSFKGNFSGSHQAEYGSYKKGFQSGDSKKSPKITNRTVRREDE